ncbi:hypothetical protein ACQVTS_32975 [Bacillus mycoides]|uniref:hypothetical protein n=1 Tax=Bacillus mycoides TaxID=1405 RepID=UPI003D649089
MFSWNEKKIIVAFFDDVNRELERIQKKKIAGVIKLTPIETYAELEKEFITLERICKSMSQQTMRILPNESKKLEENLEKIKLTLRVHKDDTRQWLLKIAIQTEEFGKLDRDDVQMMFIKIKNGLNKRGIGELRGYSTTRKEIPTVDVVLSRRQIVCFNSCLKAIHEEKWLFSATKKWCEMQLFFVSTPARFINSQENVLIYNCNYSA